MHSFYNKNKFVLLAFLIGIILLFFFYSYVLLAPNDYIFAPNGDGIKNYYTFLYHAQYDDSFSHFSGMNYPYYEHIVYTDAHPLLSWIIGKLGLAGYGIGILNFLMLFSYPIAIFFLFKILTHYQVNNWWAVGGSVCIAFLSPQIFRISGHLSLSYIFAIPLMWWLLIQCVNRKQWIWSVITSIYLIAFFLIHPYLGMIMIAFGFVFWMIRAIADRKKLMQSLGHIVIQAMIPILVFQGYVMATDTHIDRLSNPAGFFDYYASWKSILIPHHGPLNFVSEVFDINIGNWESWNYIGFSTLIFIVIIGVHLFKNRSTFAFKPFFKQELILFLIAAYLILMFAFCFPLKYFWLRWITDSFGPLKQFRVLGRFAWVFYYVFTVSAIVGIYRIYIKEKKKSILLVFVLGMLFSVAEFYPAHLDVSKSISSSPNSFKYDSVRPDLQAVIEFVDKEDFDAIIFLPMQHMSSENLMLLGGEQANFDAFLLSYHSHLPLINSISSRMSLSESIRVNNYFSPGFMEKEFTYDLPKDDRIVLVKNKDLLSLPELRMIWESNLIFENETYMVFEFDPVKWNSSDRFERIVNQEKNATIKVSDFWLSDTTNVWHIYENFDTCKNDLKSDQVFGSAGALYGKKESWTKLLTIDKADLPVGDYVVRYWFNLRIDHPDVNAVVEAKFDNDSSSWIAEFDVKQSTVIVNDWCLVEMEFSVTQQIDYLNFLLTGNGKGKPFIVDELLIQKQNDNPLFRREIRGGQTYIIYNNYWLKENSFQSKTPLYSDK